MLKVVCLIDTIICCVQYEVTFLWSLTSKTDPY